MLIANDNIAGFRVRIEALSQRFARLPDRLVMTEESLAYARSHIAGADQRLVHARDLLSEWLGRGLLDQGAAKSPTTARTPVPITEGEEEPEEDLCAAGADGVASTADPGPAVRTSAPPEIELLRAVLEDAIDTMRRNCAQDNRRKRRLYREVVQWVRDRANQSPFSFLYICAILELDPKAVTGSLLARFGPVVSRNRVSAACRDRVAPVARSGVLSPNATDRPRVRE